MDEFHRPLPPGYPDQALDVTTSVEYERGQWVVYLEVMFWDAIRRFRIEAYRTERLAHIAAEYMRRYADVDRKFPPMGF
ncbi:MAG: hypothetical protein GFH27_549287n27 [Chloroflexi bacterium AL-W]|nr:hypothetical protein [Chloroflexi bacterium AL-W]